VQQRTVSDTEIHEYFSYFQRDTVRTSINQEFQKIPSIFYAVATNDMKIIKIWIDFGADVNVIDKTSQIPLLAFAIINSLAIREDTTEAFTYLLGNGANSSVIPSAFLKSCLVDLEDFDPTKDGPSNSPAELAWCNAFFWDQLRRTINITQRYFLSRSQIYKQPGVRRHQAATHYNVSALFALPYWIIGQDQALGILTDQLLGSFILQGAKPLVLMFAGKKSSSRPSSHRLTVKTRPEWTRKDRTRETSWRCPLLRNQNNRYDRDEIRD
jgi:hypothetical protein